MVSIFHVLIINRPIEIDLWNNGDDHGKNVWDQTCTPKHCLPEMSNVGQSRLLKDGASVGDVNNKDYAFTCT